MMASAGNNSTASAHWRASGERAATGIGAQVDAPVLLSVALIAGLFLAGAAHGAGRTATVQEVEAALILNFAEFVKWPDKAFPDAKAPFVVGIIGVDPFGNVLDKTLAGTKINDHPIIVRRLRYVDSLKSCQIVYVARSERDRLEEILSSVENTPVLTISDMNDFCWRGGIINFYLDNHKVRFEINTAEAQRHELTISSELLSRAKIMGGQARSGR